MATIQDTKTRVIWDVIDRGRTVELWRMNTDMDSRIDDRWTATFDKAELLALLISGGPV